MSLSFVVAFIGQSRGEGPLRPGYGSVLSQMLSNSSATACQTN